MGSLCPSRKTYCKQREVSLTSSILTVPVDFHKPGKARPLSLPGEARLKVAFQGTGP